MLLDNAAKFGNQCARDYQTDASCLLAPVSSALVMFHIEAGEADISCWSVDDCISDQHETANRGARTL